MPVTLVRYWGSYFKSARKAHSGVTGVDRFAALGWTMHIVCDRRPADPSWLEPYRAFGVHFHFLARPRGSFDPICVRGVYDLCRRVRADIFHCHNIHTSPMIGAALAGVPVRVWSKRSMQPAFEEGRTPTLKDRLALSVRSSCALATRVHAVSQAVKDELVQLHIPAAKIVVGENSVERSQISEEARALARQELGLGPDDVLFSTIGHAVRVKGWDTLLRAFQYVVANHRTARLALVGSTQGPDERKHVEELQQVISAAGMSDRVTFLGFLGETATVLRASDAFVLPSRSEGDANALLEALAIGLPCIATRVGNAPKLIRPGDNGLLVDRDNVGQLADAMLTVGRDADLRRRLAAGARSRLDAPTSQEAEDWLFSLYDALLRERCPDMVADIRRATQHDRPFAAR